MKQHTGPHRPMQPNEIRSKDARPDEVTTVARIYGRVQGVGYRYWTEGRAKAFGLSGRVRNLTDGTVEAVLTGAPQDVARMLLLCEEGPAAAEVERVESSAPNNEVQFNGFRRAPTAPPGEPFS